MSTVAVSVGEGVGTRAGSILGGIIGGVAGSVFGPVGTVVGRTAGAYAGSLGGRMLGGYLAAQMENANEKAEENTKDAAKADTAPCCGEPNPRCRELKAKIHEKMYGRKGDGATDKGLFQRREEQIQGRYGPGEKREFKLYNENTGRWETESDIPWTGHSGQIKSRQTQVRRLIDEYDKLKCSSHPETKINRPDVERILGKDFDPPDSDWIGPTS